MFTVWNWNARVCLHGFAGRFALAVLKFVFDLKVHSIIDEPTLITYLLTAKYMSCHVMLASFLLCTSCTILIIIIIISTPVVRTGVYPHMPIAFTSNSLQHCPSPSKRRHVSHTVRDGRASLSHRSNTVEHVIDFSIFDLGGLPLRPSCLLYTSDAADE